MAYNTTSQTLTTGSTLSLSTIGYQSGVSIDLDVPGTTIYLSTPGLYYITIDAGLSSTTGSSAETLQIYSNGSAIAGAVGTADIDTADSIIPVTVSTMIGSKGCPCACSKGTAITFVITGTTPVVNNVTVNVIKMA